jgi:hypothetical protein
MEGVGRVGDELLDPVAFLDGSAEDPLGPILGRAVECLDGAVPVHQHEPLEAVVEDGAQVGLAAAQRILGARLGGAGLHPRDGGSMAGPMRARCS